MNSATPTPASPDLLDRFEAVAALAEISLTRPAHPEWEITVIHRATRKSFTHRNADMLEAMARVVAEAEQLGWLRTAASA